MRLCWAVRKDVPSWSWGLRGECRCESVVSRQLSAGPGGKPPRCSPEQINMLLIHGPETWAAQTAPRWKTRSFPTGRRGASIYLEFSLYLGDLRWFLSSLFCWRGLPAAVVWPWCACIRCTPPPVGSDPPSARFYGKKTTLSDGWRLSRETPNEDPCLLCYRLWASSPHLPFCLKNWSSNSFKFLRSLFFSSLASWSSSTSSCLCQEDKKHLKISPWSILMRGKMRECWRHTIVRLLIMKDLSGGSGLCGRKEEQSSATKLVILQIFVYYAFF